MARASRSTAIALAFSLALPTLVGKPRGALGQTPDDAHGSGWRIVREEGGLVATLSPDGARLAYAEGRSVVLVDTGRGDVLLRSEGTKGEISAVAMSADASKLAVVRMLDGPSFFISEPLRPDPSSPLDSNDILTSPVHPRGIGGGGIGGGGGVIDERGRRSSSLGSTIQHRRKFEPIVGGHYIPLSSSVEVWDVAREAVLETSLDVRHLFIAAA